MAENDGLKKLTLGLLGGGAAEELFQHELKKVVENMADPNTDAEAKRSITIQVTFEPMGADRDVAAQTLKVTSKLAGIKPAVTTTYLVEKNGVPMAIGKDIRQVDAFEPTDPSVRPISEKLSEGGAG